MSATEHQENKNLLIDVLPKKSINELLEYLVRDHIQYHEELKKNKAKSNIKLIKKTTKTEDELTTEEIHIPKNENIMESYETIPPTATPKKNKKTDPISSILYTPKQSN